MANLTITRSNEYTNKLRKIRLIVDDKELDTISNGETKEFTLSPGNHSLQAKIDHCITPKTSVNIVEGQTQSYLVDSFAQHSRFGIWAAFIYAVFKGSEYLHIQKKQQRKK